MTLLSLLFAFIILYLTHSRKPKLLYHSVLRRSSASTNNLSNSKSIILLHGLLGSARNFRSFSRIISEHLNNEYDIVMIDLNNHGRSHSISLTMSYPIMALDILHTLESIGITNFHLIGHSMGGKTAAMMALLNTKLQQQQQQLHTKVDASGKQANAKNFTITSLQILDISPVSYEKEEFSSVYNTLDFIKSSQSLIESASSRNEVLSIIDSGISDPQLRAFLITNIYEYKNKFSWKLGVNEIYNSKELIASFPILSNAYIYTGPTLVLKGARSGFVRSKHLESVKNLFPNYIIATQKDAGNIYAYTLFSILYLCISVYVCSRLYV